MYGEISTMDCSVFIKSRMIKKGYLTFFDIIYADTKKLMSDLKVSENSVGEIVENCNALLKNSRLRGAEGLVEIEITETSKILRPGCLKTQGIIEIVGFPSTGKTHFAMLSSIGWASSQLNLSVYYIDTEGSVRFDLFQQMAKIPDVLSKIHLSRVFHESQLIKFIEGAEINQVKDGSLIVVDSIHFLMKDLKNSDINRAKFMVRLGMKMNELATLKNLCFLVVNGFNNSMKVNLGNTWASTISKRIELPQYSWKIGA